MSNKNFYRAFEDKYRGSRELIKHRLEVYMSFLLPLKEIYSNVAGLDIGCGRGEWLELLRDNEILAQGIDFDEGMLKACHELNLNAMQGDGISYLKEQADDSMIFVSAFHVIEHITFDELQTLVNEALRVLKPGGLLILETPNAENLKVASENFYLDPTHIRPIPSALLSFMTEHYGYSRTKILRLQEPEGLNEQLFASLGQVIEGVSPDYAVIAQKNASSEILDLQNETFSKEFGLSLADLTKKFETRMIHFETEIDNAVSKANEADRKANEADRKANEADRKANEADRKANEAWQNYYAVLHSTSWKITKPFRLFSESIKWFIQGSKAWLSFKPGSRPQRVLKQSVTSLKNYINNHPKIKTKIMHILKYFPRLKAKLKKIDNIDDYQIKDTYTVNKEALSPRAKQIYNDLKQTGKNQKDKN